MALNLKNVTFSGNGANLSVPAGTRLKVTCGACGHVEVQSGSALQGDPICPKCGAVGRVDIISEKGA